MIEPLASLWALAVSTDPAEIAQLEAKTGNRQGDAVDHFIEDSCFCENLPDFVGGKGTSAERQAALRAAWEKQGA